MIIAVYREEVVACVKVLPWYSPARNKGLHDKLQLANIAPVDTTTRCTPVEEVTEESRRIWEL
jgi:hypothetical protein